MVETWVNYTVSLSGHKAITVNIPKFPSGISNFLLMHKLPRINVSRSQIRVRWVVKIYFGHWGQWIDTVWQIATLSEWFSYETTDKKVRHWLSFALFVSLWVFFLLCPKQGHGRTEMIQKATVNNRALRGMQIQHM